ncbi:uncharacterized protein [Leptinotarsa decemlineata]|uniref:uncharacterized protein n=1 Tax=Leptinotarsa decemlineata TaxID=7539 RepID=UPI003D306E28
MAGNRNLSAFRQLSLSCDGPKIKHKLSLKKQFSEDIPDLREWPGPDAGIKISLSNKGKPPVKHAWVEDPLTEEAVVVNKCIKEAKTSTSGKSLEKESILHSKQELAERLRHTLKDRGNEKFNLRIFLAHDSKDLDEDGRHNKEIEPELPLETPNDTPKLMTPLVINKNPFKLRKPISRSRTIFSESCSSSSPTPTIKHAFESSTVVVVPVMDSDDPSFEDVSTDSLFTKETTNSVERGIKAIDSVIIRPVSAASKREKFQKRISSAFTSTIRETPKPRRPLVRSSSAPCKPDLGKSKLNLPKNKFKPSRRLIQAKQASIDNDEVGENNEKNPKSKKELNRTTAVNGCDVVTMVSLVSPAGSDCEEVLENINEKGVQKKETPRVQEENNIPKIMSLRKAAKSVSFQQSSIHAIRSFSASFPARRASVSAALMLGNHSKSPAYPPKIQEKRSTNSTLPDDDERVPKRRLVRNNTEEPKTVSCEKPVEANLLQSNKLKPMVENIESTSVVKPSEIIVTDAEKHSSQKPVDTNDCAKTEIMIGNDKEELKSAKEKQCWNMYCKMTEKGINVSFDTILRGMLTPTEYRLSKKNLEQVSSSGATET